MNLLPITSKSEADKLRGFPCFAIDLGFAQKAKSIGTSDCSIALTFGSAINTFGNWIWQHRHGEVVLILEAPLSASFSDAGNPMPRGVFETHHSETGHPKRRVWFENAGSAMSIAAIHFMREIVRVAHEHPIWIHVLEGFCSRYGTPPPNDHQVAKKLKHEWDSARSLVRPQGHCCFSNLRLVTPSAPEVPPAVLVVPDGFSAPN